MRGGVRNTGIELLTRVVTTRGLSRISFAGAGLRVGRCEVQHESWCKFKQMLRLCDEWHRQVYTCGAICTCDKEYP